MKKIYFLIFLILFANCGKPNYPKIDASFERFDTSLLKYIDNHGNFLPDGSYVEVRVTSEGKYIYHRIPKNSYYKIVKEYYPNGNIERKYITLCVESNSLYNEYYFKENGEIEKIINHDLEYSFTFDKVLAFCRKKGIKNIPKGVKYSSAWRTEIHQMIGEEGKLLWFIEWKKHNHKSELFLLDGKTGELLGHGYGAWSFE